MRGDLQPSPLDSALPTLPILSFQLPKSIAAIRDMGPLMTYNLQWLVGSWEMVYFKVLLKIFNFFFFINKLLMLVLVNGLNHMTYS